jgi:hypothetical protein
MVARRSAASQNEQRAVLKGIGSFFDLETENARESAAQRVSRAFRSGEANRTFESPEKLSSEAAHFFDSNRETASHPVAVSEARVQRARGGSEHGGCITSGLPDARRDGPRDLLRYPGKPWSWGRLPRGERKKT